MELLIPKELLSGLMDIAKNNHPNEIILLMRGERKKQVIQLNEFLIPPFASVGQNYAGFPVHMLPIDLTIMGTVHSHPSGVLSLSVRDFHNFYGRLMMIIGSPYDDQSVAAFTKNGDAVPVYILDD